MKIFCIGLLALALNVFNLSAQHTFPVNGTSDPRHTTFVFKNARIFSDYQTVIDSAVLIVRDGKIQGLGKGLSIDQDAVVIDLKGKYIYPSFIDIFSDYGVTELKRPVREVSSPQYLSSVKGAYGWNQAVRPEYDAFRDFTTDSKKAEEYRKIGFGSVLSLNKDGIFRGSASFVLLGDGRDNDQVLVDRAASCLSFNKGSSTQDYPGSLMGAIALIRQTYYDAQWYSNGGYLKQYNISLDALGKLKSLPQIFEAGDKQNELRAASIAKEFGLTYILKGAGDEYERMQELKETKSGFILTLNFPEAYDLTDPYDALNISLDEMKHWELAPYNAAFLEDAGISFALTLSDLKNKSDFWKNLRKAIEKGLSEQEALKALTHTPATLLKIEKQVGSLKEGMLANFIITSGPVFSKESIIFENWVKGIQYKQSNLDLEDLRGNYTLNITDHKTLRLKVSGEVNAPEFNIYDDTISFKANFSRVGSLLNLSFEIKKKEMKGLYRLSGLVQQNNPLLLSGDALMPDGSWKRWTAKYDSVFSVQAKVDTASKQSDKRGEVLFPNMGYGWQTMPVSKSVLIRNATVWTNEEQGILQNTDVLISGGKIQDIGKNLKATSSVETVDGTGKHLTAGIIDEHSHIAVSSSVNEPTQSSSAEVRIADVVDADDINIYRQLAGGVTTSHLLHGSANAIGGQTQLIKLRWGHAAEKLKFENWPGFIKFALGENVKQSHWGDKQVLRFPQTRMGVEQVYRDYFTRASEYSKQKVASAGKASNTIANENVLRRDLELDALVEILEGKRHITCHSYEQSEINMLMHVADSFGFKINTFTHILEGYKVADKMKAHGVRGVSSFSDWWGYKFEVYEAIPYNGAIMHRMGLNVGYNSDDAEMARRLNQEAAKAVMYGGVTEEEAWKFVTLNPAKMLRIEDRVGSIKSGKDADLVLWSDNPLSILAKPLQTYVDGVLYYDVKMDEKLRVDNEKEKARITSRMIEAKGKGEATSKPTKKKTILKHCDDETIH
ncbi:MAG: amidohydrolase family protein [Bacteroidia bacterium]|nr:amidohydrolase family protein [Bacteroidia bacterium]